MEIILGEIWGIDEFHRLLIGNFIGMLLVSNGGRAEI